MSNTIHLHKNILDRKRNAIFLFIPTIVFVCFLVVLFSFYRARQLPEDGYETTLGDETSVDNNTSIDRK